MINDEESNKDQKTPCHGMCLEEVDPCGCCVKCPDCGADLHISQDPYTGKYVVSFVDHNT